MAAHWRALKPWIHAYRLNGEQWDGPIATQSRAIPSAIGWIRLSVTGYWVTPRLMRGFFIADPDELSLLPYVEQFADGGDPAERTVYRIAGGKIV